jgi:hypothetical protein
VKRVRWRRLGVVLSVLWVLGSGMWSMNHDANRASDNMDFLVKVCVDAENNGVKYGERLCPEAGEVYASDMAQQWPDAAIIAFVPLPFAWGLAFLCIRVFRLGRRAAATLIGAEEQRLIRYKQMISRRFTSGMCRALRMPLGKYGSILVACFRYSGADTPTSVGSLRQRSSDR